MISQKFINDTTLDVITRIAARAIPEKIMPNEGVGCIIGALIGVYWQSICEDKSIEEANKWLSNIFGVVNMSFFKIGKNFPDIKIIARDIK